MGGVLPFGEGRRRETLSVNLHPTFYSNKEVQSDDEVFHEIEDYFDEAERGEPIQVRDPLSMYSPHTLGWGQVLLVCQPFN